MGLMREGKLAHMGFPGQPLAGQQGGGEEDRLRQVARQPGLINLWPAKVDQSNCRQQLPEHVPLACNKNKSITITLGG